MALNVNFEGVWTNPNPLSKVPPGAARSAENIINPRPGIAECVAGQEALAGAYTASDERLSSGISYQGLLVESTTGATPRLYVRDTATPSLTDKGAFSPPSVVTRMPFAVAGDRLYMATSDGVRVLDGTSGTPGEVGLPAPFAPYVAPDVVVGLSIANGESVAYRVTLSRADSAGLYQTSAPSGRIVFLNGSGADAGVSLTHTLHPDAVAGDRLKTYRTEVNAVGATPGDIMYLVEEHVITEAEAAVSQYIGEDITPDELRGEPLYTNATQEGILRQNERPPLAKEITAFDDVLVLGNVRGPQRFTVRLLAPPTLGDVLTIAGHDFTAGIGSFLDGYFEPYTGGTVSENIAITAELLTRAINTSTNNTSVYAYYASGANDPPGLIVIEARSVALAAFTSQASANGERYEPPLTTAQTSLAATEPNGLWVSKKGQHYAFPPLRSNFGSYRFRVGDTGRDILRVVPLREALIVFVSGEGVWKVKRTGNESWRVDAINRTTHLLVPESVAVVDNQVIALTTRGVVAIDESGVEEIDLPIKDQIEAIKALGVDVSIPYTFAVGDGDRLRYILYHPTTSASTTSGHAWVFNADNGTWTERTDAASGGFVGAEDGLLYLGSATSNTLTRERSGTAAQIYKRPDNTAIPVKLEWTVLEEGDAGSEKQFTELRLLTEEPITGNVTFNCTNDLNGTESTTGSTSASGEPFVRAWVPDGCQRTTRLKVEIERSVLGEAFSVVGLKSLLAGMYDGTMTR